MRGKKIDSDFFKSFISECVEKNKSSNEDILLEAKNKIKFIDEKIQEAEQLKSIRSKLINIVSTFEKKDITNKIIESKTLSFFEIKNINICSIICDILKTNAIDINVLIENIKEKINIYDINFTIKQLIEHKIISKVGNCILKGDSFNEYVNFLLRA
jgi:hypothetical protein